MSTHKKLLAEQVRTFVFELLDSDMGFSGMEAGQIAHVCEMAFNAVFEQPEQPRWSRGDTYKERSKQKRELTVTNVVRSIGENGDMKISYESQHEVMGQTLTSRDVNATTIAIGRKCDNCGRCVESGQHCC